EKASKLASRHEHAARASTGTVVHMADTPPRDPANDLVIIERWIILPASFRIDESRRHLCPGTADDVIREGTLCFTSGRDSVSPAARIRPGRMEERPTVNPHGHDRQRLVNDLKAALNAGYAAHRGCIPHTLPEIIKCGLHRAGKRASLLLLPALD